MTFDEFKHTNKHKRLFKLLPTIVIFIIADFLAVMTSFGAGFFLVNTYNLDIIDFKSFVNYWPYLPVFLVVFYIFRLYPGLSLAHAEELRRFTTSSLLTHAGIILSRMIIGKQLKLDAYSVAFILSWLVSIIAFPLSRGVVRKIFQNAPWWGVPVVIFGAGQTGRLMVDRLRKKPWLGYRPVLLLDDDPSLGSEYSGIPILNGIDLGPRVADECNIDTAIVAMPGINRRQLATIVAEYVRSFRYYTLIPDYIGVTNLWMSVRDFDGVLGLYTVQSLLLPLNHNVKRLIDVTICIVGGILILPLVGILALLIKLDSPGPVFYGHHRLGKEGKIFTAWKFRSMVSNSREVLEKLLDSDPAIRLEWEASHKLHDDPRITRMGRFLRRTSLDELPQIWNVLRGEMSLVGPRPIVEEEVAKYGHHYALFSSVKPGMSGLWQVSGRSETDYEERVALDILYIQSWSLWLDMYILFKTLGVVLGGKGAY